jgi:hypothetical protein
MERGGAVEPAGAEGSIAATVRRMSDSEAQALAKQIFELDTEYRPFYDEEPSSVGPSIETVIFDLERQREIAGFQSAFWPPVGSVIELADPNRDAIVLGVRMMLMPPSVGGAAGIVVDVSDTQERGDFVPRHPVDRGL